LFVFLPEALDDIHVNVGHSVVSGGRAEGTGARAELLHERLVAAALASLGPARAHQVAVQALGVDDLALVTGVCAVDVHEGGVVDTLALPGPARTVGGGVSTGGGGTVQSH